MRYAVFTDVHANLEALEAVLAEIDSLSKEEPIDQLWFLGDLVGYGPNPNECITLLRKRTNVIIAGNHDWAAVGKIDLEDFSTAARVSAEWTAQQLTEEHRAFLTNLPERLEIGDCTLVHGSPYGPLWEYLTSEALAERSFQHFSSRLCFVGHTHVPVIFQQPDSIANAPTLPLEGVERNGSSHVPTGSEATDEMEDTADMATVASTLHTAKAAAQAESAYADPDTGQTMTEDDANMVLEKHDADTHPEVELPVTEIIIIEGALETPDDETMMTQEASDALVEETKDTEEETPLQDEQEDIVSGESALSSDDSENNEGNQEDSDERVDDGVEHETFNNESLNSEIEELLELLGLTESMIQVTNEMLTPPEGYWELPEDYRAIINPGGVGQPRDGDARAAFMIYDTERGFEFYRIPYNFHKTQEKILKVGLPQYLAIRLAYGR
ncbi:MAG TPA: metallophosphoesterase family protein [Ktedonobacteraceae bacterium]|nr:metallophosphoesterase family protein [Ktedonobacteraceae bacterium]